MAYKHKNAVLFVEFGSYEFSFERMEFLIMRTAFVLFNEWVFVCERENERINVALIEVKIGREKKVLF